MKFLPAALILVLLAPAALAVEPPAAPEIRLPDGITALLAPLYAFGGLAFAADDVRLEVAIFENDGTAWSQVARHATLRIATYDANGETDAYSYGFQASATDRVQVSVPGHVIGTQPFDMWVTIYLPDESYPTSHYSPAKNLAIAQGQYDLADALDYHHVVNPVSLG